MLLAFIGAVALAALLYGLWLWECTEHADTRHELALWRSEALGLRRELQAERNRDTTADTAEQWLRDRKARA